LEADDVQLSIADEGNTMRAVASLDPDGAAALR
jgi:hypothetical protein